MNILFENPLTTMYGPYFLILYGFIIFFTIMGLLIIKSQIDKSDRMNLPPIAPQIDPYEIAYLRGGTNEMARAVLFALMKKGLIELKTEGRTSDITRTETQINVSGLPHIEQLALNWIGTRREAKEVFDSTYGLVQQLESYGLNYHQRLEKGQMLTDTDMQSRLSLWKWAGIMMIALLGGYKIFAAVMQGYFNFLFIIIFGVVGLLIIGFSIKLPRLSKLGKTYLERLQLAFDNLKNQATYSQTANFANQTAPQTAFAGVDPMLLSVGIFGSAILAGTAFDSYNQAFARQQQQNASGGGCGGGCGSCSSCSSGDSGGSSCSSGSSCGGGCGGCGGGD